METLMQNQRKLKYALFMSEIKEYQRDSRGNIITITAKDGTQIPVVIGKHSGYGEVVDFEEDINFNGETTESEYGLNVSDYDAVIITSLNEYPFTEQTIVFVDSTPKYDAQGNLLKESADFIVKSIKNSLNHTKYLLKAIEK